MEDGQTLLQEDIYRRKMIPYRLLFYRFVVRLLPETRFFGFKASFLRWCGAKVGRNVRICSSVRFFGDGKLVIGDDVWMGPDNMIYPVYGASVTIGNCCDLGPGVMILTGTHKIDLLGSHIAGEGMVANVKIGNGCWLGARSLVLPGVILAEKTLVAAGTVVVSSVERAHSLVAGAAGKVLKRYSE